MKMRALTATALFGGLTLAACGGDSSAGFCDTVKTMEAKMESVDAVDDPAAVFAALPEIIDGFTKLESSAPAEVKAELTKMVTALKPLADNKAELAEIATALKDAGTDETKLAAIFSEHTDLIEKMSALEEMDSIDDTVFKTYAKDECGITLES